MTPPTKSSATTPSSGVPIIVIGASAGGIDALRRLVAGLPQDLHAAVLIVLHLSPTQQSNLPGILGASGPLPAAEPVNGEPIAPGRIYVAPPDRHLVVLPGRIALWQGPRENGARPSINVLFRTAARAYGRSVVGVLLSGRLSDGTAGLMMVKARGGTAVLQDPNETLYAEMPLSAIKHVDVDYVRPVAEIPPLLVELVRALPPAVQLAPVPEPSQPPVEPLVADAVEEHAAVQALSDAEASGFVCPECGGSLWETFEGGMVHYHCHVGHVYSADNLLAGQADAVERGLWTAVRALEDRAALSLRIARRLRGGGNDVAARRLEMRSRILEERAALVRLTLEQVLRPEVAQEAETGALNRRSHRRRSAAGRP